MLTLYAFSRENWARSDDEVAGLFDLLGRAIANETDELRAQGVRVRVLGRLEELPDDTRPPSRARSPAPPRAPGSSSTSRGTTPGRTELVDAFRRIAAAGIPPDEIDERTISAALYTAGLPDPDLVIRTGGEQRLSNFLIWQSAYAGAGVQRTACGRTSGPTRSTPRSWSSPGARAGSGARRRPVLRTRALSALVLVPPLVLALVIGLPAIAAVLVLVAAARRAWRSSGS